MPQRINRVYTRNDPNLSGQPPLSYSYTNTNTTQDPSNINFPLLRSHSSCQVLNSFYKKPLKPTFRL